MQHAPLLAMSALCLAASGSAGDGLAIAGRAGTTLDDGRTEWLQAFDGSLGAWVLDPAGQVPGGDGDRIVLGETLLDASATVPVLEIREVLPAAWAEPAVWSRRLRGPSAFAGLRTSWEPGTFAGIPASDRRAGVNDGGPLRAFQPSVVEAGSLGPVSIMATRDGWTLLATAPMGRAVTLLRAEFLSGPYHIAGEAAAGREGVVLFTTWMRGETAFFRMELR